MGINLTLTPTELQQLIEQLTAALLPTFEKRVSVASKATSEALRCLTVAEAGERLRMHPKTVLKYIGDGRLKAANVGTLERPQYLVSEADLQAFYKAHRLGR